MAQYHVNLSFSADASKAKAQLKDLQNQLTNLINIPQAKLGIEGEINSAIKAAAELKAHLQAATNVRTGNLDFSKLNQSLKQSNTSLTQYATKLQQLGPAGQQAFMTLAQSVAQAEIPIRRSSAALDKMWETLKNTARWQVSSTVLHGFMGAVQSAYGYAQDLNGSLNDIRIVTGQNTEQMAKFAKEANKAAKALSTSTTNYTKASLIYYQQGLTDQQVKDRTDITIKMANVARSSAEDVSDQLTAVWNNFYDGSKSLEHYADVMTALGAATASSTDEISEGLNKFASVAETVGLSYEYAASALATVTATTRESADVVGNAFKTLFARIQGLKLGETLDDGTDLNKYSQALDAVGIQIKDVNGEIKDMDTILNELGAKWNTLGKDQQIALAQTVAGVRQYTQLIALMDNWDYFQENLSVANNSTGALEEQAEIYAESWEAASKRVEAAAQGIYQKLVDDDFFIDLLNSFEKVLNFVDNLIDGLGGLKGVLLTLGTVATKMFGDKLSQSLSNAAYNIKMMTKAGRQSVQDERANFIKQAVSSIPQSKDYVTSVEGAQMKNMKDTLELQVLMTDNASKMSQTELTVNQLLLDRNKIFQQQYEQAAAAREASSTTVAEMRQELIESQKAYTSVQGSHYFQSNIGQHLNNYMGASIGAQGVQTMLNQLSTHTTSKSDIKEAIKFAQELKKMLPQSTEKDAYNNLLDGFIQDLKTGTTTAQDLEARLNQLKTGFEGGKQWHRAALDVETKHGQGDPAKVQALTEAVDENTKKIIAQQQAEAEAAKHRKHVEKTIKDSTGAQQSWSDTLVQSAQAAMGFASAISMIGGIWDTLQDPDLSGWEKFTTIMTTLGMLIPTLVTAWTSLKTVINSETLVKITNALATWGQVQAEKALNQTKGQGGKITKDNIKQTLADTKDKMKNGWGNIKDKFGNIRDNWNKAAFEKKYGATVHANGTSSMKGAKGLISKAQTSQMMSGAGKEALMSGLKTAGGAALTVGVVVAALAAAKAIYKKADELYNKDELAAAEAEASAKRMQEAYEKVNAEYNELKNSIESYDNAVNGLKDLKVGTVEYADAVASANEQALKLIDTYDELAGQYQVTTEGLIVFNEAALDNLQIMELQNRNTAQAAALIAQQNARSARTNSNVTDFAREDLAGSNKGISDEDKSIIGKGAAIGLGAGAVGGAIAGVKIGGSIGSIAGPIGTAIGAVVGTVLGLAVGGIVAAIDSKEATENEKKAIDAIYDLYDEIGSAALTEENIKKALEGEGITDPELIASLVDNRAALEDLMKEMDANTQAMRAQNQMMARNEIAAQDQHFNTYNENLQNALTGVVADNKELLGERFNYDESRYRSYKFPGYVGTDKGKEVAKAWAEANGLKNFEITNFKEDVIKYKYYDSNTGKTEEKEIDYNDLANWEKAQKITEATKNNYEQIKQAIVELSALDPTDGILEYLGTGDISALKASEVKELAEAYESGVFDEKFRELAQLTGENYAQTVADAINSWDYDTALSKYAERIRGQIDGIFEAGAQETEVDARALENYADVLMKGSTALSTYADEWDRLDNEKIAAEIAVANAKFAKGVVQLNTVFAENLATLQDWNEESLETWEAVAQVQDALEQVFGLKLSADFVKENLTDIQALAEGDVTNLEVLREAAAKDFILNLDISDAQKNQFTSFIEELSDIAKDNTIEIGAHIDDASYINQLNKMLEAGEITAEEVKSTFAAIGYSVDVKTTTRTVKNTTRFNYKDKNGQEYSGTYTTETDMEVPYIAGEGTENPNTTTAADGSVIGPKEAGTGFTYQGTKNTGAGLLSSLQEDSVKNKNQLDRYHYISRVLKELENDYDAISQARERAFGADKLALYDREIQQLEKVRDALQKNANEAKAYYETDRQKLFDEFAGVQLDAEGNIINYDELFAKYGQRDDFNDIISNYEDSLDTWKESIQGVIDKNNELLDLSLEKIQYKIDLSVKIDDQSQEYLDFLIEMADDPLTDAADKLGYLTQKINSGANAAKELGEYLREALQETGWSNEDINTLLNGPDEKTLTTLLTSNELTETQIEMLEQYRDQLYATTQMMLTWADDIKDTVVEAFDQMGEAFDKSAQKLEHYNTILTTYENIIDLVGQDTLGVSNEVMAQLSQDQVNNAIATLSVHRTAYETNKQALEDLRSSYNEDWSDDAKVAWNEAIEHAEEKVRESEATMFQSWESALQAAAEAFEKAVETAVKAYEKAMSGIHGSFDAMQTAYERQTTLNERYVEDYEKIYSLSKLNRQVQNSIDETNNVKAKKELAALQAEILALSESDAEVSQYQIDSLQKQYDLKMAQIALEEAQNAKSQVRMRRDSEGNWGYVYTADPEVTEAAEQNYEDKLFEYQDFIQGYIQQNSDALMQLQQEYANAMANIKRENFATQEEYEAALAETTAFYESMMNYHIGEIGLATTDAQELYTQDWVKYNEMTGYKISKDDEWIDSWEETQYALTTGLTTVEQAQQAFKNASEILIGQLSTAYDQWKTNVNTAMEAAGSSVEYFAEDLQGYVDNISIETQNIVYSLEDIAVAAQTAFKGVVDAATANFDTYSTKIAEWIAKNTDLIASLNAVIAAKTKVENTTTTNPTTVDVVTGDLSYYEDDDTPVTPQPQTPATPSVKTYDDEDFTPSRVTPRDDSTYKFKVGDTIWSSHDDVVYAYNSDDGYSSHKNKITVGGRRVFDPGQNYYEHAYATIVERRAVGSGGDRVNWYKIKTIVQRGSDIEHVYPWITGHNLEKFDTGGYTGSWDSNGRLAMLHQKELVLNAADTENMLKAVEIVRKIVRVIDLNAANAANAFGALTATTATTNEQIIDQQVTIHAEFPNATNHSEIEEAFNNLINHATQFANRKK